MVRETNHAYMDGCSNIVGRSNLALFLYKSLASTQRRKKRSRLILWRCPSLSGFNSLFYNKTNGNPCLFFPLPVQIFEWLRNEWLRTDGTTMGIERIAFDDTDVFSLNGPRLSLLVQIFPISTNLSRIRQIIKFHGNSGSCLNSS
jgi:hypothetical protein